MANVIGSSSRSHLDTESRFLLRSFCLLLTCWLTLTGMSVFRPTQRNLQKASPERPAISSRMVAGS